MYRDVFKGWVKTEPAKMKNILHGFIRCYDIKPLADIFNQYANSNSPHPKYFIETIREYSKLNSCGTIFFKEKNNTANNQINDGLDINSRRLLAQREHKKREKLPPVDNSKNQDSRNGG